MSGEIRTFQEMGKFIIQNHDQHELINMALKNFLKKLQFATHPIEYSFSSHVLKELCKISAFDLIPGVLTDAVLKKIENWRPVIHVLGDSMPKELFLELLTGKFLTRMQNGLHLASIILGLVKAGAFSSISGLLKGDFLVKIRDGLEVRAVTNVLVQSLPHDQFSIQISMLLTDAVLAKIHEKSDLIEIINSLLGGGYYGYKSLLLISNILSSNAIRKKFPEVCDENFSSQVNSYLYFSSPSLSAVVASAIRSNIRWSPMRRAWLEGVARGVLLKSPQIATVLMGAGASAGGVSIAALPIKRFSPERAALIDACRRYSDKYDQSSRRGLELIRALIELLVDGFKTDDEIKVYLKKKSGIYDFFGAEERKRLIKPSADAFLKSLCEGHEASKVSMAK
jgi:hypothetical protein